jgi:hypothetical protein
LIFYTCTDLYAAGFLHGAFKIPFRRDTFKARLFLGKALRVEPFPKPIDCALTRTVLGQARAVFQAFSLAKPRISRLLFQN